MVALSLQLVPLSLEPPKALFEGVISQQFSKGNWEDYLKDHPMTCTWLITMFSS